MKIEIDTVEDIYGRKQYKESEFDEITSALKGCADVKKLVGGGVACGNQYHDRNYEHMIKQERRWYVRCIPLYNEAKVGNEQYKRYTESFMEDIEKKIEHLEGRKVEYLRTNFYIAEVISKRGGELQRISEVVQNLDFVLKCEIRCQTLITDLNATKLDISNSAWEASRRLTYENDDTCFLPIKPEDEDEGSKKMIRAEEWVDGHILSIGGKTVRFRCEHCDNGIPCTASILDRIEKMKRDLVKEMWPKIRKLLDYCFCKNYSACLAGIVGWDCTHINKCSCLKSKCISKETALDILHQEESDTEYDTSFSSESSVSTDSSSPSDNESSNEEDPWSKYC